MNIAIDSGNTNIKVGLFEEALLTKKFIFSSIDQLSAFLDVTTAENFIVSSVTGSLESVLASVHVSGKIINLTSKLFLPIRNLYATPETLGVDRIAAACGAWQLYPNEASLVIDIGTCINYEFVNQQGEYLGGAISPGVRMRFAAMHQYTAKLPIVEPNSEPPLTGGSTSGSLQSGVMNGILEEIKGMIKRYHQEHPLLKVILCGGDAHFFEKHLNPSIFVAPELVLMGLNSILLNNVK